MNDHIKGKDRASEIKERSKEWEKAKRDWQWEWEKIDQSNGIEEKRKSVGMRRVIKKSRKKRQKKAYCDCVQYKDWAWDLIKFHKEKGDNL